MNIQELELLNAHNETFDSEVLSEIEQYRERLRQKIVRLKIMGSFRDVKKIADQIVFLDKTKKSMRRLLGVFEWIQ